MKKLVLLLLFIPLMSFGQVTYDDLMSIKSVETFKKVVIENGYEYDSTDDNGIIWYGYNITKDSIEGNRSPKWASYQKSDGAFRFKLSRTIPRPFEYVSGSGKMIYQVIGYHLGKLVRKLVNYLKSDTDNSKNEYDLIVDDIKAKCKYFEIIENNGNNYITYSCSDSSYKGKIGFVIEEGSGIIRHFPPE